MSSKTILTKEGYLKLQQEFEDLKVKRDLLIERIEEVAQPDEAGEDGLAFQLKEELEVVNNKIDYLEDSLANVELMNGKASKDHIQVGSKVKIRISGAHEKEFHIVSEFEADPSVNKISDQSPLGQALVGKKLHDEIDFLAPIGKLTYKIVAIA